LTIARRTRLIGGRNHAPNVTELVHHMSHLLLGLLNAGCQRLDAAVGSNYSPRSMNESDDDDDR